MGQRLREHHDVAGPQRHFHRHAGRDLGGRGKLALWLPGTHRKPPRPGRWSTSAHCTATKPVRIVAAVDGVVLRGVERLAAAVQAETIGARPHDDAVRMVEAGIGATELDDDVEDAVVVEQIAEPSCGDQMPSEPLAHDVVAGVRRLHHVDGNVQRFDVTR